MFKKRNKDRSNADVDEKMTRTVVTETIETVGGVQTTRKVITASSKDDIDSALKSFNFDPEKFRSGGTSVTKKIVYSSSSGQKEVIEETVETYNEDPVQEDDARAIREAKASRPLIERLGLKSSKTHSPNPSNCDVGSCSAVKPGKFEDDCLKSHNAYRAKHGVPNLKLSKQLCAYAKEWADYLATNDKFQHRTERKYGENIYMKWSSDPNHTVLGNEAVDSWYSEIKDYTFNGEPTSLISGHFTQVIWKESKEMGCAWSRSNNGKVLVVANYDPPGNFVGHYSSNVPSLKK